MFSNNQNATASPTKLSQQNLLQLQQQLQQQKPAPSKSQSAGQGTSDAGVVPQDQPGSALSGPALNQIMDRSPKRDGSISIKQEDESISASANCDSSSEFRMQPFRKTLHASSQNPKSNYQKVLQRQLIQKHGPQLGGLNLPAQDRAQPASGSSESQFHDVSSRGSSHRSGSAGSSSLQQDELNIFPFREKNKQSKAPGEAQGRPRQSSQFRTKRPDSNNGVAKTNRATGSGSPAGKEQPEAAGLQTLPEARDRLSQFGKLTNLDFDQHYTDRLTNVNDLFHREIEVVLSKYEPPCDDSSSKGSVQDDTEQEPAQPRESSSQSDTLYLVKFTNTSYLHVKWVLALQIIQTQCQQSIQALLDFNKNQQNDRNPCHAPTNFEELQQFIAAQDLSSDVCERRRRILSRIRDNDDFDTNPVQIARLGHISMNAVKIEQVVSTPSLFPLIHPRGSLRVKGTWMEECLRILHVLIHLRRKSFCLGLKFTAMDLVIDKEQLSKVSSVLEQSLSPPYDQNLSEILNLLYNRGFNKPADFWNAVGKVFKIYMIVDQNPDSKERKFCSILRTLALHMFRKWQSSCSAEDGAMGEEEKDQRESIPAKQQVGTSKLKPSPHIREEQPSATRGFTSLAFKPQTQQGEDVHVESQQPKLDTIANQNPYQVSDDSPFKPGDLAVPVPQGQMPQRPIPLQPLSAPTSQTLVDQFMGSYQVFKTFLDSHGMGSDLKSADPSLGRQEVVNSLDLLVQNQKMIEGLLMNIQSMSNNTIMHEQGLSIVQGPDVGSCDPELLQLRKQMLDQSSVELQKAMRKRPIMEIESNGSSDQTGKFGARTEKASDGKVSSDKSSNPVNFIFQNQAQNIAPIAQNPEQNSRNGSNQKSEVSSNSSDNPLKQLQREFNQSLAANEDEQLGGDKQQAYSQLAEAVKNYLSATSKHTNTKAPENQSLPKAPATTKLPAPVQQAQNRHSTTTITPSVNQTLPKLPSLQAGTKQHEKKIVINKKQPSDLAWLLFPEETEEQVSTNIYLQKEEILQIIEKIKLPFSSRNGDKQDRDRQILIPLKQRDQLFSFDPIYLVKWKRKSYTELTWEPLTVLIGENRRKVKEFIHGQRATEMSVRYNMVQIKRLHESLLEASSSQQLSDNQRTVKMLIDQKSKSILDNFIMLKINESQIENLDEHNMCKSFMDDGVEKQERKNHHNEQKFKNLKLIKNQHQCKNWLLQAFVQNRNVILADERGLGKTVTLLVFLNHLKSQYKINGPFLIIAPLEKLEQWRHMAEKWTNLKTLVYYDSNPDLQKGLKQLRKWVFYKKDVTIKGKFTERSQLFKFEMLITTAEVIQRDTEQVLKKVPFLQIIVDDAEDPVQQQALDYFACKRFILATSNPIPHQINDLWNILEIIDPAFFSNESQKHFVSGKIQSVQCIRQLFELSRPYILRHRALEAEPLLNNFEDVELSVDMTKPQKLFYRELFLRYADLLAKLEQVSFLDQSQLAKLTSFNDLLLKCCNSLLLVDESINDLIDHPQSKLKHAQKQQLVSGKMLLLQQLIDKLGKKGQKLIVCSRQRSMLMLLKKFLKETGVPCFMHQAGLSIDSVYRFNLYSGQAIFLFELGEQYFKEFSTQFDFDFTQNVVIFDTNGDPVNDLLALLQVCRVPFSVRVTVYRLITSHSLEQMLHQQDARKKAVHHAIFHSQAQQQIWSHSFDRSLAGNLAFPFRFDTQPSDTLKMTSDLDLKEYLHLIKLSAEAALMLDHHDQALFGNESECFASSVRKGVQQPVTTLSFEQILNNSNLHSQEVNTKVQKFVYAALTCLQSTSVQGMPALDSQQFWNELFNVADLEALGRARALCCDDALCQTIFQDQGQVGGQQLVESADQRLYKGKVKYPCIAEMIAARLEGTEKNRLLRLQQNGMRISPGPVAPQSVMQNHHQNHIIQSQKALFRDKRQDNMTQDQSKRAQHADDLSKPSDIESKLDRSTSREKFIETRSRPVEEQKKPQIVQSSDSVTNPEPMHMTDDINPENKKSNGNICPLCYTIVKEKHPSSIKCKGPCKQIYHLDCAQAHFDPDLFQNVKYHDKVEHRSDLSDDDKMQAKSHSFYCDICTQNLAVCYICKKPGAIQEQQLLKRKRGMGQLEANNSCQEDEEMGEQRDLENGEVFSISKQDPSKQKVEKCIVGSCNKFYHLECLKTNPNVDFYINNKKINRFRCPHHYCSGCGISGNSVQILQCVECPTSYHLKCFRADRFAIKLTKKFILCGKHSYLKKNRQGVHKKIQDAENSHQARRENSKKGNSAPEEIESNAVDSSNQLCGSSIIKITASPHARKRERKQQMKMMSKPNFKFQTD